MSYSTDKKRPHEQSSAPSSPPSPKRRWATPPSSIPPPGFGADAYFAALYRQPPDFRALARKDAGFAAFLKNGQLDFEDPAAMLQLTRTLAEQDFGLKLELPDARLCPPIPNRHNYILWLKGLLDSTSPPSSSGRPVVGLDVGTGASCIYPLLACVQRPWALFATDIDPTNHTSAARNISRNNLAHRIHLLPLRSPSDPLIPPETISSPSLDFVMTNPPFYASPDEMLTCAAEKRRPPLSACTGAPVEMVVPGGEVSFVSRLLDESLALRGHVRWYTAMLGKRASLDVMVATLREVGVGNYAVAELVQGRATRRWVLGWSFGRERPAMDVARGVKAASRGGGGGGGDILPPITEADVLVVPEWDSHGRPGIGISALGKRVEDAISALELVSWEWDPHHLEGTGRAAGNVWSRAWRRRKARGEVVIIDAGQETAEPTVEFGFRVEVRARTRDSRVWCRWLEGMDPLVYESFRGWLARKIQDAGVVGGTLDPPLPDDATDATKGGV